MCRVCVIRASHHCTTIKVTPKVRRRLLSPLARVWASNDPTIHAILNRRRAGSACARRHGSHGETVPGPRRIEHRTTTPCASAPRLWYKRASHRIDEASCDVVTGLRIAHCIRCTGISASETFCYAPQAMQAIPQPTVAWLLVSVYENNGHHRHGAMTHSEPVWRTPTRRPCTEHTAHCTPHIARRTEELQACK